MTHDAIAYLTKPNAKGQGLMTLLGETKARRYNLGMSKLTIEPGLYEVNYRVHEGVRHGRPYQSIYLNRATPRPPSDLTELAGFLRTVTARADKIIERLEGLPLEEALRLIGDATFLASVPGIGPKIAQDLARKLSRFDEEEYQLYQALSSHGLVYRRELGRCRWARAYYQAYPGELETLRKNPYSLLEITGDKRSAALRTALPPGEGGPLRAAAYSLDEIDRGVLERDPRWYYMAPRVRAHLTRAVDQVIQEGHSVAIAEDVLAALKAQGLDRITHSLTGTPQPIGPERLRALVKSHPDLVNLTFTDARGAQRWGITRHYLVRWQEEIARTVGELVRMGSAFSPMKAQEMYDAALASAGVDLTDEQKLALTYAFNNRLAAITGNPGTGKTTIAQSFLTGIQQASVEEYVYDPTRPDRTYVRSAVNTYILAPTGAAAQRIRLGLELYHPLTGELITPSKITRDWMERTNHLAQGRVMLGTIHAFLGFRGEGLPWMLPEPHPSVIVLDEASMVDEEPMYYLMCYARKCIERGVPCTLLLLGDVDQLPPVGVGFPFRDILGTRFGSSVPSVRLTVPKRQRKGSAIVRASQCILHQELPPTLEDYEQEGISHEETDFLWIQPRRSDVLEITGLLADYVRYLRERGETNREGLPVSESDVQIIVPLRNPSQIEPEALHVNEINRVLQEYYARQRGTVIHTLTGRSFRDESDDTAFPVRLAEGDRVVHTGVNGYGTAAHEPVMRGSIGRVARIEDGRVEVVYPWIDPPVVYGEPREYSQLSLAYAVTGHASQGSEYDYVYLALPFRAGPKLVDKSWLYTAVTRGKKHLLLLAPKSRVARAIAMNNGLDRYTLLAQQLVRTH